MVKVFNKTYYLIKVKQKVSILVGYFNYSKYCSLRLHKNKLSKKAHKDYYLLKYKV